MSLRILPEMEQPESWRPVPGFDGYEVSDLGRVRSFRAHGGRPQARLLSEPRLKTTRRHGTGYRAVVLQVAPGRSQAFPVHVLVAAAFLGPRPEGLQVAHADGDKMNARLDNLRYATPRENAADKHLHGTTCRGITNGRAKLTDDQVRAVVARCRTGERQVDVAQAFGISQSMVSNIVRGAAWAHLRLTEVAS